MKRFLSRLRVSLSIVASYAALHATAVAAAGVLSFGLNSAGQLGLGTQYYGADSATPILTTNLGARNVTQVDAGEGHSLLLADDGSVFSFGWGYWGQLGLGTTGDYILAATPILTSNLGSRKITQVAAGSTHSLLLADDGSVFACGENADGRTGLGMTSYPPTLLATPIITTNLGGRKIIQVDAGYNHSLLLAEDGTVFSFGGNGSGKTGLGTTSGVTTVATPIDTTNLGARKITQVAAGTAHSLLLADDGGVFSFGNNNVGSYRSLGLGTSSPLHVPVATPIDTTNLGGRKITQVAAGGSHSLLLTEDGSVFSFGSNSDAATGLGFYGGSVTTVATPIITTNLRGQKITQVAGGAYHSLLLADDGSVFSFGANDAEQLGLGAVDPAVWLYPVATPIDTTNLSGLAVTQVAAGGHHNLLIAVPDLPGDFNNDGSVDAADYVVWRKTDGGNSLGYTDWQENFGEGMGAGGGSAGASHPQSSVPEPATLLLLMFATAGWCLRRDRASAKVPSSR